MRRPLCRGAPIVPIWTKIGDRDDDPFEGLWWSKTRRSSIVARRGAPSFDRRASPSDSSKTRTASCRGMGEAVRWRWRWWWRWWWWRWQRQRCLRFRLVEHFLDVLRRLAHVLIDQLGAVDDHERTADVEAHRLGRQRLAGAGDAVKEGGDPLRFAVLLLEAPLPEEHRLRVVCEARERSAPNCAELRRIARAWAFE